MAGLKKKNLNVLLEALRFFGDEVDFLQGLGQGNHFRGLTPRPFTHGSS